MKTPEAACRTKKKCSEKNMFLKISKNPWENTCVTVSFLIKLQSLVCSFIKKEILTHVFSCWFCKTYKNTHFVEHLRWLLLKRVETN